MQDIAFKEGQLSVETVKTDTEQPSAAPNEEDK
jgi:hypothetical protein